MSTSYNKGTQGARVGNWVEEEALKAVTGTHRYETWATDAACEGTARLTIGVRERGGANRCSGSVVAPVCVSCVPVCRVPVWASASRPGSAIVCGGVLSSS